MIVGMHRRICERENAKRVVSFLTTRVPLVVLLVVPLAVQLHLLCNIVTRTVHPNHFADRSWTAQGGCLLSRMCTACIIEHELWSSSPLRIYSRPLSR